MSAPDTVDFEAAGVREALARSAEMRLIGLLLSRPDGARDRLAEALLPECADAALRDAARRTVRMSRADYTSLFGPGGPASPREAAYAGRRDPARAMAELASLYEAFGFRPGAADPADHVAVEAAFAAWLHMKEAYALCRGDAEAADVTVHARDVFLREHLAVLAGGLASRVAASGDPGLAALVAALLERAGGPPLPETGLEGGEAEDELSCGPCPEEPRA